MENSENAAGSEYVLGLDLGAQSIGWAMLVQQGDKPSGVVKLGVRVFDAGVDGSIESGQDASRNVKRREKRMARRILRRRTQRLLKLARILQGAGLLPAGNVAAAPDRDRLFAQLDKLIFGRHTAELAKDDPMRRAAAQLPYFLRARALSVKLLPHEFGRALCHLAKRRGFWSNRKERFQEEAGDADTKKKLGPVKEGIKELDKKMDEAHVQTLGEYFSKLDPEKERIRKRWTARDMYKKEFEAIWSAQAAHHPGILTDALKKEVYDAIFFQRPLRNQKFLIGVCSLEPKAKRARWALIISQRFRLLQRVNDIMVTDKKTGEIRPLSKEERQSLIDELEGKGDRTFVQIRKLPGFKNYLFNLEEGDEKKLPGNRTAARLIKVLGAERWAKLSAQEHDRIVQDVLSLEDKPEALKQHGMTAWGLDKEAAEHFANVALEPDYCNLSTKAMKKLLPKLEEGVQYATARKDVYGEVVTHTEPVDSLAGVNKGLPALRNPAVNRVLTELRILVNSLVREYGRPAEIRIELARDLKKNRKQRKEIWQKNRGRQNERESAVGKIAADIGLANPKGADIEKVLLAEECGWICPYTGRPISMASLVGTEPQFDVEHIIPLSRSFDNSFVNKTLCYHDENRMVKRGRTPFEAYSADKAKYDGILDRLRKFNGSAAREKLRRFQLDDLSEFEEFAARMLNDTRYASREAANYVGLLFGGTIDAAGKRRVKVSRGQVTKFLRDKWGLNAILSDGGEKSRDDHRHHAVDALVIALTEDRTIKMLSDAATRAESQHRRRFASVEPPWEGFLEDAGKAVGEIIVSHRPSRRVSGQLHEETLYSPPCDETGRPDPKGQYHHVRKPLENLSKSEVEDIADPKVKGAVKAKLAELRVDDPKKSKVFSNAANLPCLTVKKDGRKVPIRKARLLKKMTTQAVGTGYQTRHVQLGSNHHVEIFETTDKKGGVKWDGEVVSMLEAHRRKQAGEPIVRREHGPGTTFKFSLCGGDIIQVDEKNGGCGLYVIRTVNAAIGRVEFVGIRDARMKKDILAAGDWKTAFWEPLRKLNCQKVIVTPLGEVRRAND